MATHLRESTDLERVAAYLSATRAERRRTTAHSEPSAGPATPNADG